MEQNMKTEKTRMFVCCFSVSQRTLALFPLRNIQASEVSGCGTDAVAPRGRKICRMLRRGVYHGVSKGLETQGMIKLE